MPNTRKHYYPQRHRPLKLLNSISFRTIKKKEIKFCEGCMASSALVILLHPKVGNKKLTLPASPASGFSKLVSYPLKHLHPPDNVDAITLQSQFFILPWRPLQKKRLKNEKDEKSTRITFEDSAYHECFSKKAQKIIIKA